MGTADNLNRSLLLLLFAGWLVFPSFTLSARNFQEVGPPRALVVLNPDDPAVISSVRSEIDSLGGRTDVVFEPGNCLMVNLAPQRWQEIRDLSGVKGVYPDHVPSEALSGLSGDQKKVAGIWNRILDPRPIRSPGPGARMFPDAVKPNENRPTRTGRTRQPKAFYPHDPYVTSEWMIGQVRAEVLFLESDGSIDPNTEDWDPARVESCLTKFVEGLIYWTNQIESRYPHPGPPYTPYTNSLTWVINWQTVTTGYEPIQSIGKTTDGTDGAEIWIADAMANLGFSNPYGAWEGWNRTYDFLATKRTIDDDWIFATYVVDSLNDPDGAFTSGGYGFANYGGSYQVFTYDIGSWGHNYFDATTAHETGHIFHSLDEYAGSSNCAAISSGLYAVPNWNHETACVYDVPCVMRGDYSVYHWDTPLCYDLSDRGTDDQIGWRDANTNGVLDAIDTTPSVTLDPYPADPTALTILTYTGSAQEGTDASSPGTRIMGGDFRIDNGPWLPIATGDFAPGIKYSAVTFTFDTPPLVPGTHTVETRIMNQIGRYDYSSDTVTITGNTATATPTVTPGTAATATPTATRTTTSTITSTVTPRTDGMDEWGIWPTSGLWHMVEDGVSPYPNSHSPPYAMWYGQDATGDYDDGTANSGSTWTMGVFFGIAPDSYLTFWSWEETEGAAGVDRRMVGIHSNTTGVTDWPWESTDNSGAWRLVTIDLSAYAGDDIKLQFWFSTESTANNNFRGWYVDDVQIQELTPTPTSTPTGTSTPTSTPSNTPTHSPSPTYSHTPTSTTTDSATTTPTITLTATVSATPTATPTVTISHTATATSSITATATGTHTPTESPVYSITVSPTVTETATLTPSPTVTETATPSPSHTTSHTATTTGTITPTATPTNSPSATATISETATASSTRTASETATPSATPSHSPTRSPTRSATRTVSETATPTATATATPSASPSATPTATPTATPQATFSVTPTATASGTITPTLTMRPSDTATLTPTPGVLKIDDLSFYPNPYCGGEGRIAYKLSAPSSKVRLRVYTTSYRLVLDRQQVPGGYGSYEYFFFTGRDNLLQKMANGTYIYLLEAYEGSNVLDRRVGKLVILR